jgi:hypothetical protein
MPDTGLEQFLDWGTATTVNTSVGKVTGGSLAWDSALAHREGIGAQDAIVGGPIVLGGSFDVILQSEAILAYAFRSGYTAPTMTALCVAGGTTGAGRKQTGAYINTLTLRQAVGEPLTASIEWLALTDEAYTTAPVAYPSDLSWEWYSTHDLTIDGQTLECTSFEITLNNNLEPIYTLDASTASQARWPDSIKIGSQEVSASFDVLTRPGNTTIADIIADTLTSDNGAVMHVQGGTSGTDQLAITLTNLARVSTSEPFTIGGDLVTYNIAFEAKKNADVISWAAP